ncbi:MAG: HlyD family type I secretion periplasmic adaptor subunit [Cyanobacteria bacterium P01_A01_bin.114]
MNQQTSLELSRDRSADTSPSVSAEMTPPSSVSTPEPATGRRDPSSATPPPVSSLPIWSDALESVLDRPPAGFPKYLIAAGTAFSLLFLIWANTGQVQEVSNARGRLIPQGQTYKVQPVAQGEVAHLKVKEGDPVQQGDILVELETDTVKAEVIRLQQSLATYRQKLAQVNDLMTQAKLELTTHQQIANADIEAQAAVLKQLQAETHTQHQLLSSLSAETPLYQERVDRFSNLEAEGAVSKEYLFDIEQAAREQARTITQAQGQLQQSLERGTQLEAELTQKHIEKQRIELETVKNLQQLQIEAEDLRGQIAETQTMLKEAELRLSQRFLRAPVDGIISRLNLSNSGEVLQPGYTAAEIAPSHAPLILSAIVPSQEAGLINIGMETQIKLDAFPFQDYGILSGEITTISPDAELDEELGNGYRVEIALERDHVIHESKPVKFQAGQLATADVIVRRRKIIDILLDPIRQLKKSDLNL